MRAAVVFLCLVFSLVGFGCGSTTTTIVLTQTVTAAGATEEAPDASSTQTGPTETTGSGRTIRPIPGTGPDEGLVFTVHSLRVVPSLPVDQYTEGGPIRAVKGAKLVRADVTFRNDTKQSADPFCGGSSATLVDNQDRNFEPIENQIDIANNPICDDVQPGFQSSVILAFQIPAKAKVNGLALFNGNSSADFDTTTYVYFHA